MKNEDTHHCSNEAMEHCVCRTAERLSKLYDMGSEDTPDSLLSGYPNSVHVIEGLTILIDSMIPGRMSHSDVEPREFGLFLVRRLSHAWRLLRPEIEKAIPFRWKGRAAQSEGPPPETDAHEESYSIMQKFYERLPDVRTLVIEDIRAAYDGDPAALTYAEVQLAYPGLLAVVAHRLAHELHRLGVPVVPRIMSEWIHSKTGVDINPGAQIGHGLFIDHATGVVIGETSKIGNRVKLYQGVTLGARSFPLDENGMPIKHIQRHPTVEDDVVIYSNATILGGDTIIGKGSTIGGNVFLMESVPPNSFVASKHPELHIKQR